jgi:ribosomal protein S12 methylthiotransferase accessory factor
MTRLHQYGVPAQWLPFLGGKLGIAKALYCLATDPEDLQLHHVFPVVTSLGPLLGQPHTFDPHAGGAGHRLEDTINRAMGELLERYASFAYVGASRALATYAELLERGYRLIPLENLKHFSPEQYRSVSFPYAEFTEASRVDWLEGSNLLDGLPMYVPAQIVGLGYHHVDKGMLSCFYPTSSGCAIATSVEEALLKGLLEVIERDAIMIRWYARIPPPALNFDPENLLRDCFGVQSCGLEIRFHDMTVDGEVPVVGVTCIERTGRPCFFILSAAAACDVPTAARKALIEAGQGRPFLKSIAISEVPRKGAAFDDFKSNLRFYAEPSNAPYVEWFLQNKSLSTRKFLVFPDGDNALESLRTLLDHCRTMAVTPIAFDMTTPDMRDAGLFACKVVVPELVPLSVPSAPFLGHPRLARFIASHKGTTSDDVPEWIPHPFP